ncbi:MAG: RnfH family protein [Rhodoferax sp.]|nr:RnfH family protein [Rhodoferax sp.]
MVNSSPPQLRVTVVYAAAARRVQAVPLELNATSTVWQAVLASGLPALFPDLLATAPLMGVWGRKVAAGHLLRDQDRVELYRPLRVDPKVARRARFVKQGARTAGLFANRRAGAKPGY